MMRIVSRIFVALLHCLLLIAAGCQTAANSSAVVDQSTQVVETPDRLVCAMVDRNARPYFTFVFKFSGDRVSMSYLASSVLGAEEVQVERLWDGMNDMPAYWLDSSQSLSFEGDGDGDAGFGKIVHNAGRWSGWVHFPEGGPDGTPEDQRIDIGCRGEEFAGGERPEVEDGRYICGMTDTQARPYFTFIVSVSGGLVSLSYLRNAFFGSEEVSVERDWEGMNSMRADWQESGRRLVFEGDGDAGYGEITNFQGQWSGSIHFPKGGPEGVMEDERINIGCRQDP